jgi:DNA-binding LacI/PurR family transcriptional regulator
MLATKLKLSPTTVSEALRGVPRVAKATVEEVRAAAAELGYSCSPIAGAVMSQLRRSGSTRYRGTLGVIELADPQRAKSAQTFLDRLFEGAARRSAELGFTLDRFVIGGREMRASQLNKVLAARAVQGVLVLPCLLDACLEEISWTHLSVIYLDRLNECPPMNSISADHHGAMWGALQRLERLGYRRPGLVLQAQVDYRLQNRWEGGYFGYTQTHQQGAVPPVLVSREITEERFCAWFRAHQPDVVLAHGSRCLEWMLKLGARFPGTHGYVNLNVTTGERESAAIDLRPPVIGARGAELLIGQIFRGEFGLPADPCHTSVPSIFLSGSTLRTLPEAAPGAAR